MHDTWKSMVPAVARGSEDEADEAHRTRDIRRDAVRLARGGQSYARKGIARQGIGSFCREILCSSTMPCRLMPLLVHFWGGHVPHGLPGAGPDDSARLPTRGLLGGGAAPLSLSLSLSLSLYIYIYTAPRAQPRKTRHWPNAYLAQRVPSLFLAGSFRICLNCEVSLKVCFPGGLGTH